MICLEAALDNLGLVVGAELQPSAATVALALLIRTSVREVILCIAN